MRQTSYFIGADIGTQGTKVSLVDDQGGIVLSSFQPSRLIQADKGIVEQDPNDMFDSVLKGIREVVMRSGIDNGNILGIGMDGQMAGILGIDRNWQAVTPYDSWLDTRCDAYMPHLKEWDEEKIIRITGCPVTYAHGPKILWWKHERPNDYTKIEKFVVPTVYVAGRLAGLKSEQAFIDYTHLHFSGFANVNERIWSSELLDSFNVSGDKMPRIVSPWDVIGHLTKSNAEYSGLKAGTPIVAGCGDTAATILGAGITEKGKMLDVAGTASVLSCCVDEYQPDIQSKTLIYARSVIEGLWTPLAYINGGGQCIEWFRKQMGGQDANAALQDLNEGATPVRPGSNGLYFVPHFAGRVCPNNPLLRGSWLGLNWTHDRYSMYRSILESIAYEYRIYLDIIARLISTMAFTSVTAVGGGAKSDLFNSIKADVLNVPYITQNITDTAVVANAVIAGYGIGYYTDIPGTIQKIVQTRQTYTPVEANHMLYRKFADSYSFILEKLTPIYQRLSDG